MGARLIVEVLDHAPPGLTPAERLVAVILAEQARDETRLAYPGEERLLERSRLTDRSLRRTLTKLVEAGVLERVPVGVDKTGAPVFACNGRRAQYRILQLAPKGDTSDPLPPAGEDQADPVKEDVSDRLRAVEGGRVGPPSEAEGGHVGPRRGTPRTAKGDTSDPPIPQEPSDNPQIRARDVGIVVSGLRARTGKTIDEPHAERVVRQILEAAPYRVRDTGRYLAGAINRDADPERFLPTPVPPRFVRHA